MNTTEPTKTVLSFVDGNNNRATIDIEITFRNGYKELTLSGEYDNGAGQVQDRIKPANKGQKKLLAMWKKYHLKNVSKVADIDEQIEAIETLINEAEEERAGKPLTDMEEGDLLELIREKTHFDDDRDVELCAAFVQMFGLCENDLGDIEIDGNRSTVQGVSYLAGTDSEMDDEWDASLDSYLDDCVLPELPEQAQKYFDREAWKEDAKVDDRAHSLNHWNGGEEMATVNGTIYYAYRN